MNRNGTVGMRRGKRRFVKMADRLKNKEEMFCQFKEKLYLCGRNKGNDARYIAEE